MESIMTKNIQLVTPKDVKEFCFAASELPRNVSTTVSHDKYSIDAKSILGMFSLDLCQPVTLTITSEDNLPKEKIDKLFAKWEVED